MTISVFDKYLHWPCVKCKCKKIYTCQQCKCKKFGHVSVNEITLTQDLHAI